MDWFVGLLFIFLGLAILIELQIKKFPKELLGRNQIMKKILEKE